MARCTCSFQHPDAKGAARGRRLVLGQCHTFLASHCHERISADALCNVLLWDTDAWAEHRALHMVALGIDTRGAYYPAIVYGNQAQISLIAPSTVTVHPYPEGNKGDVYSPGSMFTTPHLSLRAGAQTNNGIGVDVVLALTPATAERLALDLLDAVRALAVARAGARQQF